jgi:ATP-binding cassette subfamily F protein 3
MSEENIRTILGAFLFTGDDSDKKVKVLSGGEKSRLILAKLLINPPNFLLLDEPTTHLDVDAVEALVRALGEYQGTIVFISHDIYFVRSIANLVYEVKDGRVRKFPGSFDYYLEKKAKGEIYLPPASAIKPEYHKKDELAEKAKSKELLRKEEDKKRKEHNAKIKEKINKLNQEKTKLNLESSAKKRAIEQPRSYRDDRDLEEYIIRIQEIEKRIYEINKEIVSLKKE